MEKIGQGAWADVIKARCKSTGVTFAVKIINKRMMYDKSSSAELLLKKECEALQSVFHPNIVKAQEFCTDDEYFYIVMELVNGDSLTKLIDNRAMPEIRARYIVR